MRCTKFKLSAICANAAFSESPAMETARILRDLADRIEAEHCGRLPDEYRLRDINGNVVGDARFYLGLD